MKTFLRPWGLHPSLLLFFFKYLAKCAEIATEMLIKYCNSVYILCHINDWMHMKMIISALAINIINKYNVVAYSSHKLQATLISWLLCVLRLLFANTSAVEIIKQMLWMMIMMKSDHFHHMIQVTNYKIYNILCLSKINFYTHFQAVICQYSCLTMLALLLTNVWQYKCLDNN